MEYLNEKKNATTSAKRGKREKRDLVSGSMVETNGSTKLNGEGRRTNGHDVLTKNPKFCSRKKKQKKKIRAANKGGVHAK